MSCFSISLLITQLFSSLVNLGGKAKAKGVYAKRGASINIEKIRELQKEGLTITAIARALDISRMSVYRINKQN